MNRRDRKGQAWIEIPLECHFFTSWHCAGQRAAGLAKHLAFDRRQLRSVLADLVTASLIDVVTVEHRGAETVAYCISDVGRHLVIADQFA